METAARDGFTIPGEAGYEELVLRLADQWGADVIRDSDGTKLSEKLLHSGKRIYATVCPIREHNEWLKHNLDARQQTFLMAGPVLATESTVKIYLLDGYDSEQFTVDTEHCSRWQVFDRTTNQQLDTWSFDAASGDVLVQHVTPWHRVTVNFLAYRIWEEISMYNHITNGWCSEKLMPLDPWHPKAQAYMVEWMHHWCQAHSDVDVVRFTSMFFNFVWIWGSDSQHRNLFTDWASYDFTVSAEALCQFEVQTGHKITSEDFINKGSLCATHLPANEKKIMWMDFVNQFVVSFGRRLIDIVHSYGKLAYVFYDDSWVGVEPYGDRFAQLGFDGIIKCVFSGFEVRMCANCSAVKSHELRLHPYLFPTGLTGNPVFQDGGHPEADAKKYWSSTRRAMLRDKVERIGLGGYLHLVSKFPDFCDAITEIADEFRTIRALHTAGKPYCIPLHIGILTAWGKLRTWTCSGHFHENYDNDLMNLLERLSGLPVEVTFLDFDDIKSEMIDNLDVIINAGNMGSAWSGGFHWDNCGVVEALTQWSYNGGTFMGIGEPSAVLGYDTCFRVAHILGIDLDLGSKVCHGRRSYTVDNHGVIPSGASIAGKRGLYLLDADTVVLREDNDAPSVTVHKFGRGQGIYLAAYHHSFENTRMLLQFLLLRKGQTLSQRYIPDNLYTDCAWFPDGQTLVVINNTDTTQSTKVLTEFGEYAVTLPPYGGNFVKIDCKNI